MQPAEPGFAHRGCAVPRDADGHVQARIEISPLTALSADDIPADKVPSEIAVDADIAL